MTLHLSSEYELHSISCISNGLIVFNKSTGRIFKLNESGYWILSQFLTPALSENVLTLFKARYKGDLEVMETDFWHIIDVYVSSGILLCTPKDADS